MFSTTSERRMLREYAGSWTDIWRRTASLSWRRGFRTVTRTTSRIFSTLMAGSRFSVPASSEFSARSFKTPRAPTRSSFFHAVTEALAMWSHLDGRLKVLQVVDELGMGGAETWLMELVRWWHRQGTDAPHMDFLVTSGKPGLFDHEARALGAKIFYLRYGRSSLASFARGFKQILRRGAYSAIHDHQGYASGLHFLLGARGLPRIRVVHVHNAMYQLGNLRLDRRLAARVGKSLIARYSTHIAGTSRQLITEYGFDTPGFGRISRAALYCGFDPARFVGDVDATKSSVCREFGWPEDAKIILFAGRIDQSPDVGHPENCKNSGFAVSVGIECARRDARIHMILAGALSPAVPVLEQRVAAAGFAGRIRFVGIRDDVERRVIAGVCQRVPSRGG